MAGQTKNDDNIEIPVGKYISAVRKNPWKVASIVLFIALVAVFLWKLPAGDNSISEQKAINNLLSFINSSGAGSAKVLSSSVVGPFYEVQLEFQGQQFPAQITKDGNFLIVNVIPISADAPALDNVQSPQSFNINISGSPSEGNESAKVVIAEFTDYQSPSVRAYFNESYPSLKKDYIDTGKVLYVIKDYPLSSQHPEAEKAAEAARCVAEQKGDTGYFRMHDLLLKNQDSLGAENYRKWAAQLGVNVGKFDSCMSEGTYAAAVQQDISYGKQLGVAGTPTFFIDGKIMAGAPSYSTFSRLIEQELSL